MQYDEIDLLTYRVENIEKRLDHMESLLLKSNSTNNNNNNISSELLHMMFDMIKQQVRIGEHPKTHQPMEQQGTTNDAEPEKSNFDKISCMARRRTIV